MFTLLMITYFNPLSIGLLYAENFNAKYLKNI